MEIKGKVIQVLPMEGGTSKNGNAWQKASLVVEVAENPQYPKKVKISNMRNAGAFAVIPVGTEVTFRVEVESREFNGRWYTEVSCWKWEAAQSAPPSPAPQAAPAQPQTGGWQDVYAPFDPVASAPQPMAQGDDLPF